MASNDHFVPVLSPHLTTRPHSPHPSHHGAIIAHSMRNETGLVPGQRRKGEGAKSSPIDRSVLIHCSIFSRFSFSSSPPSPPHLSPNSLPFLSVEGPLDFTNRSYAMHKVTGNKGLASGFRDQPPTAGSLYSRAASSLLAGVREVGTVRFLSFPIKTGTRGG